MKYFGGCDVGSTYTKAVILDETGKMVADTTIRSKINSEASAVAAMAEVCEKAGLKSSKELSYLVGTGYGRNKVPFADENISEISCHAMGVHVTNPEVKAIIDIGGQDVKGISVDTDGTVKNFAMNDKCAAGIEMAVAKRCFVMAKKAGATDSITLTGGCAKNEGLKDAIEHVLKLKVVNLKTDPQLMGALGAAEYARQKGLAKK